MTSTPSTRRLLDGVAVSIPHCSPEPAPYTLVDFHTGYDWMDVNLKLDGRKCLPKRTNSLVNEGLERANCEATTPWLRAPTKPTQALRTPDASSSGKVMFSLLCVRGTSTAFRRVYVLSKEGASGGGVQPYLPKSISWFFARSRGGGGGSGAAASIALAFSASLFVA